MADSYKKIDGVAWVERTIPTTNGDLKLVGMTAREMRRILDQVDPDDLIVYMAEVTPEVKEMDLFIGIVACVLSEGNCGTTFLCGPEAVTALKSAGMVPEN